MVTMVPGQGGQFQSKASPNRRRRWQEAAGPGMGVGVKDRSPSVRTGLEGGLGRGSCRNVTGFPKSPGPRPLSFLQEKTVFPECALQGLCWLWLSLFGRLCSPSVYFIAKKSEPEVLSLPSRYDVAVTALSHVSCYVWWTDSSVSFFFHRSILPLSLGAKWWNPCNETRDLYLNKRPPHIGHFQSSSSLWRIRLSSVWQSLCCKLW